GFPIVYTSADSVFQIAAHEARLPVEELYRDCRIAREILTGPHAVGRVIARPFVGEPGRFVRTDRRRDFSLPPPAPTVLDRVVGALAPADLLIVTADHGNDPTTPSTDHTREYVPLLVAGPLVRAGADLGVRSTFADLGATVAQALGTSAPDAGTGFLAEVLAG